MTEHINLIYKSPASKTSWPIWQILQLTSIKMHQTITTNVVNKNKVVNPSALPSNWCTGSHTNVKFTPNRRPSWSSPSYMPCTHYTTNMTSYCGSHTLQQESAVACSDAPKLAKICKHWLKRNNIYKQELTMANKCKHWAKIESFSVNTVREGANICKYGPKKGHSQLQL